VAPGLPVGLTRLDAPAIVPGAGGPRVPGSGGEDSMGVDQPTVVRAILDTEQGLARLAVVRDAAWDALGPRARALLFLPAAEDALPDGGHGVCLTLDDIARWRASEGGGVFANLPPEFAEWARLDTEHRALDRERQRLIAGLSIEEDLLLEDARACRARH